MKTKCALVTIVTAALFLFTAGCGKKQLDTGTPVTLLNVSYDPTRELYREYNARFSQSWLAQTGQTVTIEMSHGGSGKQARSVIDGLEADVVTLATASDINAIAANSGLLPVTWQSQRPHNSAPYYSTMVFIVREGNPKHIRDWGDLVREDVSVITPNPKTSGAARWSYLAAWAWAMHNTPDSSLATDLSPSQYSHVRAWMADLYANVPVLDSGARGASNTFTQNQLGDVLINWENEAFLMNEEMADQGFEIVVPSISILAEPPVALLPVNAKKHGTETVANAYLDSLYTWTTQKMVGQFHYRPRNQEAFALYTDKFPELNLVTVDDFGGWGKAQAEHFNDGGVFDDIMRTVRESRR